MQFQGWPVLMYLFWGYLRAAVFHLRELSFSKYMQSIYYVLARCLGDKSESNDY